MQNSFKKPIVTHTLSKSRAILPAVQINKICPPPTYSTQVTLSSDSGKNHSLHFYNTN
jgi:hypothetical protein